MSIGSSDAKFRVGYALPAKKIHSFIQPSLVDHTNQRGIDLIPIDPEKSLIEQGPFHCIIHKLYDDNWKNQLEELVSKNPQVIIIDLPSAIEPLRNRVSMLQVVDGLEVENAANVGFGIPKQTVVHEEDVESLSSLGKLGLKFPVIAKSLAAEGSGSAHDMLLVFDEQGLKKVKLPVVLQEFVNHGGVVFKVYVVGDYVQCVKRRSLPNVTADDINKLGFKEGVLFFSQISNLNAYKDKEISCFGEVNIDEAEMPPMSFVSGLARALQRKLKLHLFNFDMIRDVYHREDRYLVIDINYFPGYAKMPGFATVLTDFFWDILHGRGGNIAQ